MLQHDIDQLKKMLDEKHKTIMKFVNDIDTETDKEGSDLRRYNDKEQMMEVVKKFIQDKADETKQFIKEAKERALKQRKQELLDFKNKETHSKEVFEKISKRGDILQNDINELSKLLKKLNDITKSQIGDIKIDINYWSHPDKMTEWVNALLSKTFSMNERENSKY